MSDESVLRAASRLKGLPDAELRAMRERIGNLVPSAVFVSSVTEGGLDPLRRALLASAREGTHLSEVRFSSSDGKLLAQLHREANVLAQKTENGELILTVRLGQAAAEKLRRAGATIC